MRVLVTALLGALLLSGCSGLTGTGDKGYVTQEGTVTEVPEAERGKPVELTGKGLDGKQIDLAELRGKPVVVPVWGSWCAPCRAEAGILADLDREYDGKAEFVGINTRDGSPSQGQAFNRRYGVDFDSVFSPDGSALLAFDAGLSPRAVPSFVLLDRKGRVAALILGTLPSAGTLGTLVDDLVSEPGNG